MNGMQADSLRAVLDSVFASPAYRWVERPDPLAELRRWFGELVRWVAALRETHPLGYRLVVAGLVAVLIGILVHAAWVLVRTVRPGPESGAGMVLPMARRDRGWFAREAERLAAAGRFAEAMQADFLALVLALDAARLVRFHPAKTPREYAREPELGPGARAELGDLAGTLYGYAFAGRPCGAREYEAWRERVTPERYAAPH